MLWYTLRTARLNYCTTADRRQKILKSDVHVSRFRLSEQTPAPSRSHGLVCICSEGLKAEAKKRSSSPGEVRMSRFTTTSDRGYPGNGREWTVSRVAFSLRLQSLHPTDLGKHYFLPSLTLVASMPVLSLTFLLETCRRGSLDASDHLSSSPKRNV